MERKVIIYRGLGALGLILCALGLGLGYGFFPHLIKEKVAQNLDLFDDESVGYKNFVEAPTNVYMKVMLFEVQNPNEIQTGQKPILKERGPYTYRETRIKKDIARSKDDKCSISFGQYKAYTFYGDASCENCQADDNITLLNAPFVGMVEKLRSLGFFGKIFLKQLENVVTTGREDANTPYHEEWLDDLFIKVKVEDFLFKGIKPGVLNWALGENYALFGNQLPYLIQKHNGFAAFNTKNDTTNEYYEIDSGKCSSRKNDPMIEYYNILKWGTEKNQLFDDLTPVDWWIENNGYNKSNACNTLTGTDAQQFHPDVKKDEHLWVFQADLCRSIFLEFKEMVDVDGLEALWFAPPPLALQVNTTHNLGFCKQVERLVPWEDCVTASADPDILNLTDCYSDPGYTGKCHDGILDITQCMQGAPVILSGAHFYQSPSDLLEMLEGISHPDYKLHETQIVIEPITGTAIRLHKRIQINMPLVQFDEVTYLNNVTSVIFPMFWIDEGADIDEENVEKLKNIVYKPIVTLKATQWTLTILGFLIFVASVIKLLC